jgi:hypothetical protein
MSAFIRRGDHRASGGLPEMHGPLEKTSIVVDAFPATDPAGLNISSIIDGTSN